MIVETSPLLRVLCVTDDEMLGALVRETLATALPSTIVEVEDSDWVPREALARAACMVLDNEPTGASGLEVLRRYRASGFSGAAVLLLSDPQPAAAMQAASLGAPLTVLKREIVAQLPAAVAAAARPAFGAGKWLALYDELRRTQQLIAIGQNTSRVRHDMSNPLTVATSETQMLLADPTLSAKQRESITQVLAMCRRVTEYLKRLDSGVSSQRLDPEIALLLAADEPEPDGPPGEPPV